MDELRTATEYEARTYDDEDRRPLDIEFESLSKAVSQLDDELRRLADRLLPVTSDRAVPAALREGTARDSTDSRSATVRKLDELHEQIDRMREHVESLFHRVDC